MSEEDVDAFQSVLQLVHHLPAKNVLRLVDSGRVDQNYLPVVSIKNSLYPIARGLRLRRDDGHLSTNKRVYKSRLTSVGTSDNSNESRFK